MAFVNADDRNKEDYELLGSEIEFTNRKTLAFKTKNGTEEWGFNNHSFNQLAQSLKIPARYLANCAITGKGSMKDQIERQMEGRVANQFLLRVRRQEEKIEGVSGVIRAVLPGTHVPFDHRHLVKAVQRALHELGSGWKMVMTNAHDPKDVESAFHLRFVQEEQFDIGGGDMHKMGFHCRTSEVGMEDISVAALVWRLVCLNGMMGWGDSDVLRIKHKNHVRHEVFPQLHEGILAASRQREAIKDMLERASVEEVKDPESSLLLLGKRMRVPETVTEHALGRLREDNRGEAVQRYHILQAFTAAARDLPLTDRVQVEEAVGNFMFGVNTRQRHANRTFDLDN
jgi:hypothetical protein